MSDKIELATISESLKAECDQAVLLPENALTKLDETAQLWLQDRVSLSGCRERHKALVEAVNTRDAIQGRQDD